MWDEESPGGSAAPPVEQPLEPPEPELWPRHGCGGFVVAVALALVANALLVLLVAAVRAQPLAGIGSLSDDPVVLWSGLVLSQAAFLTPVALAGVWLAGRSRDELGLCWPGLRVVLVGAVGALAFSLAGDWLLEAVRAWRPDLPSVLDDIGGALSGRSGLALAASLALLTVLPAVGEEGLFRGLLFRAFARGWGVAVAVLLTAALFAAVHLDLLQGVAALTVGLYLGLLRHLGGSLVPCIVAHGANNLVASLLAIRAGGGFAYAPTDAQALSGLALGLLCLAWLAARREA